MSKEAPKTAEQMLIEDMAEFSMDPYGFVLYSFPWGSGELADFDGPDDWQAAALKRIGEQLRAGGDLGCIIREAIASGHGVGKSAFLSWLSLWGMATYEDTMAVITANTEKQLYTKTWPSLAKWYRLFIARHWFKLTATALFSVVPGHEKTWRLDSIPWSETNTEAFAGLHNQGKRILILFDEASAIADTIWDVSQGALTDQNTQIIWCAFGNPTRNSGKFKECFTGKASKRWHHEQIDSRTCKMTNKVQIQEWIDDCGIDSDFVKVRVRGMFPNMSVKQFFALGDVDAAFGKHLRLEQYNFAPKILTCDPAWEGDDMLEIGLRQGLHFKLLRTIPKNDNDIEMAGILAQLEDSERADAVFIDAGYGTGIASCGRTWGRDWTLVWFAGESSDPGMLNKRAQMANEVKAWLKGGGAIPDNLELYEDILAPETVARTDGKVQLESKKDIKKRLGRSPGKLDILLLSFAFPVVSKSMRQGQRGSNKAITDYDPLGD